jgi:MFS family permease
MRWRGSLVSFQHRNFSLLWIGQLISVTGSMAQSAAILWHVSLLAPPSHKGLALGMVGLVRVIPIVLLSVVGGVVADAHDRHRTLLVTQSSMAVLSGILAYLTFSGRVTLGLVYVLAALLSGVGSFDGPARQAFFPNLVPREHLPNAISLNTILFQAASVAGPSLGGIAIAALGVSWVYALNAVSFLAVIVALLLMRNVPRLTRVEPGALSWRAAIQGIRFVFSAPLIRGSMFLDFVATFFSSATGLLPIFAQDILHVGPTGYGWLYASTSIGAVAASAMMVRGVDRIRRGGRVLFVAVAAYGAWTVLFGISRSFWLTFLCLAAIGASDTVSTVLRNIIRQLTTPDELRGRMTSVNMVFFMGGPQLGELEAGLVAQAFGAPFSVVSGGVLCLAATAWIAARTPQLRRYRHEVHSVA